MREILFRGKRVDNVEWAESSYPYGTMSGGVVQHDFIPETVGEFTGLTDKNGVKIFECDIIKTDHELGAVRFGEYTDIEGRWHIGFYIRWETNLLRPDILYWVNNEKIEVIGNIHDNPELLGGETSDTD